MLEIALYLCLRACIHVCVRVSQSGYMGVDFIVGGGAGGQNRARGAWPFAYHLVHMFTLNSIATLLPIPTKVKLRS